jgi:hypothetical protein
MRKAGRFLILPGHRVNVPRTFDAMLGAASVASVVGEERSKRPEPIWQETLNRKFSVNLFGEPNVRIVWAPSILENVAGLWTDRDPESGALVRQVAGVRRVQKYAHLGERWVLEKWVPPERYGSPGVWDAMNEQAVGFETFDTLGAFPHRGEYEHVFTFEYPDSPAVKPEFRGAFAEPSVARIERWADGYATGQRMNYFERLAAIKKNIERREKIRDQEASDKYDELCKEAFYGAPFVSVPGHPDAGERPKE